jgi:hypothetical protein
VEPASGKAENGGLEDLGATIDEGNVRWDLRYGGTMNERSFIVKSLTDLMNGGLHTADLADGGL